MISVKARAGKSLLQLFVFTVICILVLSGLTIQTAATKSSELARTQLGGEVTLQADMTKLMEQQQGAGGRAKFQPVSVSEEVASELLTLEHIKGYNFYANATAIAANFAPIESEESEDTSTSTAEDKGGQMEMMPGKMMGDVSMQGVMFTDAVSEFREEQSTLVEGRHLSNMDAGQNFLLMEITLAEENDLSIGDRVSLQSTTAEDLVEYEIVGLYETTVSADNTQQGRDFAALNPYNKLYVPYSSLTPFKRDKTDGTIDSAVYFIDDPVNIDSFVELAKETGLIDLDTYMLDKNDQLFQQMMGPIEHVASFSSNVVILVTVTGAMILGLIVMMSIRERKYEMGVLMAIGEKRWKLVGQFLTEILVIAILALGLSSISGDFVATKVGDQLLQQQLIDSEAEIDPAAFKQRMPMFGGQNQVLQVDPIDELNIQVTNEDLSMLALIGLLIAVLSTLLPSLSILRMQPKTILSKQD
jgi:putative ABC transport system permease protein